MSKWCTTAVIDVASPHPNYEKIGWALDGLVMGRGKNLDDFVRLVADALGKGSVALGFEAPLFIPFRDDPTQLCTARNGEGNRAYSAQAGTGALVAGLAVNWYILRELRRLVPSATVSFEWKTPSNEPGHLLIWEAFVSDRSKTGAVADSDPNISDALEAIKRFKEIIQNHEESDIVEPVCLNLIAAILLRTGWIENLAILAQPCLVAKTKKPPGALK